MMKLEKMDDFFAARIDGYDEHMKRDIEGASGFYAYTASLLPLAGGSRVLEKTLPTLIQTNETKKSTQIDAFFESKPKIDAFLKIDANAQRQEYKMAS